MEIFKRIGPLQSLLNDQRHRGAELGLVPTMGALHDGHMSLVNASKKKGHFTVCSLFVNPAQFNNPSDLEKYPRNIAADESMLRRANCDVLFAPDVIEMYEHEPQIHFDFGTLGRVLEGKFRPGHFSGVALVVSKLFNIVRPDHAYFGLKDFQQFRIISLLNDELKFGIHLHGMPTVRESDGLAMSSRNLLLGPEERLQGAAIFRSLKQARVDLLDGMSWESVYSKTVHALSFSPAVRLEYLELANKYTLNSSFDNLADTILLVAAHIGNVRLIDNLSIRE